jgi:uncharacterized SAM-dependent methyltransferase
MQRQAQISPKFLYDAHGCALFEQITELPEYYPTRTEAAIMARYDLEIARHGGLPGVDRAGSGQLRKSATPVPQRGAAAVSGSGYCGRVSAGRCGQAGARLPATYGSCSCGGFHGDWHLPSGVPQTRRELFYPGSSIGNFDTQQALHMLGHMHSLLGATAGC